MCDGPCKEVQFIWKNHEGKRYCKNCWGAHSGNKQKGKPTVCKTPIPSRSPKRAKEERLYLAKRIIFLSKHPICHAHLPGCTTQSSQVHHKQGRIAKLLLDEEKWLPVCYSCHQHIEDHPLEAIRLGFSIPRVAKENSDDERLGEL